MNVIEQHKSPDQLLSLIVVRDDEGDLSIGFDGYTWHTHGDILASLAGETEENAVRQFIERIISDKQVIAVAKVDGKVCEVWATDDPAGEFKYKPPEESIEFRYWSGTPLNK
jgi:hypothetical protein